MRAAKRAPGGRPLTSESTSTSAQSVRDAIEDGVGRHERRYVSQHGASEPLPQLCETSPLRIGEPRPPSRQLRFQHTVRLAKKRDHITLLAFEPSEQRGEEHL